MAVITEGASRAKSLVLVYIVLGSKKMKQLVSYCGKLVFSYRNIGDTWELTALRKNTEKLMKKLVAFFEDEGISYSTKEGLSRLVFPFKKALSKATCRRLGLGMTPMGAVFLDCVEKVKESLRPVIAEENKAFAKWDAMVDGLLAHFTEKKQFTAKKWLEMTEPVVRNLSA